MDLNLATLSVVQAVHQLRGGLIVYQEPKNAKARRSVALPPSAALMLRGLWEKQAERIPFSGHD